ncbi:cytochrome c biogenesis protein [Tepiditoga spiralis]|uniref:Cytochrome c biogenesis protein n=1 Tax=Tepiditoga spiralis TaxID=2108365 RepID=A0A7G1G588_9BACT|nr:cytochrome C biogenesis protein [Tepiditoga spiralis]BBE30057.1 cytochrome c biogenesis protein [Tepiditoga spiralis]
MDNIYKIEVFIPEKFLNELRIAMNNTGACKYGNYDNCISYSKVKSMWRPLEGTNPYLGEIGKLCFADEIKVEAICKGEFLKDTVKAIKQVHPYEEPVINIIPLYEI